MGLVQVHYLSPPEWLQFEILVTQLTVAAHKRLEEDPKLDLSVQGWLEENTEIAFFFPGEKTAFCQFRVPDSFDPMELADIVIERLKQLLLPNVSLLSEPATYSQDGSWIKKISTC